MKFEIFFCSLAYWTCILDEDSRYRIAFETPMKYLLRRQEENYVICGFRIICYREWGKQHMNVSKLDPIEAHVVRIHSLNALTNKHSGNWVRSSIYIWFRPATERSEANTREVGILPNKIKMNETNYLSEIKHFEKYSSFKFHQRKIPNMMIMYDEILIQPLTTGRTDSQDMFVVCI